MTQANQSEGISPELEEKIHEMQVKSPSGCPNFIGCSRSWKSSCRLCQRTRTTSSRCCLKAPSRQPADQVLKGVVDVPLLLGLRGDHQRLPRPRGVRVRQRGVRGRTRGTRRDLDVSILLPCLHSASCPQARMVHRPSNEPKCPSRCKLTNFGRKRVWGLVLVHSGRVISKPSPTMQLLT